ncbi:MAG TPA: tetratricopeptide repeat protein [Acidobacteriota bacterium]|nr:tetratricopeptide repeat protein [Acidobacteriota bacterium]
MRKLILLFLSLLLIASSLAGTVAENYMPASPSPQTTQKSPGKTVVKKSTKVTPKPEPTPQQLEAEEYFKQAEAMVGTAEENSDRQIGLLEKAFSLDPDLVSAAFNLGIIYSRLRDPKKALTYFDKVIQKMPLDSTVAANSHYLAALNLKAQGEVIQAKDHLQKSLAANPKHPEALGLLGEIYLDEGKVEEATAAMEKAIEANPKMPEVYYRLAAIAHKSGKNDDALKYYQKFVELSPDNSGAQLNLAILLAGMDRLEEASKYAERATQLDPKNVEAWAELGKIKWSAGKEGEAEEALRHVIVLQSKWSEAHRLYVTLLLKGNKLSEADSVLTEAIKSNPKEAEVYSLTGELAFQLKDPVKALQSYAKAYELNPTPESTFDFAMAYLRNNLDPMAEEFFRKAVQMKPGFGEAWFNLGLLNDRRNDTAEALTAYRQAEGAGIREGMLFYRMGFLYARVKDIDRALSYLMKAVNTEPDRWKKRLREDLKAVTSDLDIVRYRPEFQKLIQ